ncbi:hypothetical protein E4T48_01827 [Aureobasidium sp. EXF-10727]|nr:hypothetical protein E4T48_01827 [Aureobasidium sp. EXF-10727]
MSVSSSDSDAEHPLIALTNQTTQEPTGEHQRDGAITPTPQHQEQLQVQNTPPPHLPFLQSFIDAMLHRGNPYTGSGQRRLSSAHATVGQQTTTYTNNSSVPTSSCNPGAEQNPPPSYVSDPSTSGLVSPTLPSNANISQTMPPPRPELQHMIVSVNRQKYTSDDLQWTTQFPLENLRIPSTVTNTFSIDQLSYSRLLGEIFDNLRKQVEEEGLSIVWVMSGIEQLGIVRDNGSLRAAVLDHQNVGKYTVQFYIVMEKAEGTLLPQSQVCTSKTFVLPKAAAPRSNVLSPEFNQQDDTPKQPSFPTFGKNYGA